MNYCPGLAGSKSTFISKMGLVTNAACSSADIICWLCPPLHPRWYGSFDEFCYRLKFAYNLRKTRQIMDVQSIHVNLKKIILLPFNEFFSTAWRMLNDSKIRQIYPVTTRTSAIHRLPPLWCWRSTKSHRTPLSQQMLGLTTKMMMMDETPNFSSKNSRKKWDIVNQPRAKMGKNWVQLCQYAHDSRLANQ